MNKTSIEGFVKLQYIPVALQGYANVQGCAYIHKKTWEQTPEKALPSHLWNIIET